MIVIETVAAMLALRLSSSCPGSWWTDVRGYGFDLAYDLVLVLDLVPEEALRLRECLVGACRMGIVG